MKPKFSKIMFVLGLCCAALFYNSCKTGGSDPVPDPNPNPTTDEMYIILNGQKIICKVPAKKYRTYIHPSLKDTCLEWIGNIPIGAGGDTTLDIRHGGPRVSGVNYKVKDIAVKDDEVSCNIQWSIVAGKPAVNIDGGNYTIEKKNGKWVSTLKNGTGYDANVAGKNYTDIEFRIVWPE
ncbi:MAG: hypothetical protein H6605_00055 [Flavobacteriales bacterium]|nr:hypothetical protein [Flavobacteriales bacterium]